MTLYERQAPPRRAAPEARAHHPSGTRTPVTMSAASTPSVRPVLQHLRGLLLHVPTTGCAGLTGPARLPAAAPARPTASRDSFRHVPRTPPWSALGFAALSPSFTLPGPVRHMDPVAALPLLDVRVPEIYDRLDHTAAHDFLDAVRFPDKARHLAFEVFSRSFFADPRQLSAAGDGADVPTSTSSAPPRACCSTCPARPSPPPLWHPLADYLLRHGAELRTSTAVEHITPTRDGGHRVVTDADERRHDGVVLALDTAGLRRVVAGSDHLGDAPWRERIARLRNAPAFLVTRLWLDRPVAPGRPGFLGTAGFPTLDNISVLERWEDEAARWAGRTGGSVVELHAYAVPGSASWDVEEKRLIEQMHRVYPETRGATVVDARHEWRADCPLFAVGGYRDRPTVRTPPTRVSWSPATWSAPACPWR
ncbi:FAD-dependent oxidoreductase [Streptomyces echinatus]|uniref:FAD-dependent oxidoreductase n=1 Tax=Streptomyces echinatus TaxID=67293 RepID=UPI0031E62A49